MWISIKKLVLGSILLMTDHQIYSILFQLRQWRIKTNQNKIKRRKLTLQEASQAVPLSPSSEEAPVRRPWRLAVAARAAPACPCSVCGAWPWPPVQRPPARAALALLLQRPPARAVSAAPGRGRPCGALLPLRRPPGSRSA
jgi:hypothetical protein